MRERGFRADLLRVRRSMVRWRFWWLVTLAVVVGVAGDAISSGWWAQAVPFLATWWPWLLVGATAAAVASRLVWWFWWWLPKLEVDRLRLPVAKERADVEDNFRKTAGQILGGAAVLIGAGAAYLQFTQQQRSAQDLLISNQVSKGFELLGNKDNQLEQRLGGIYALEGVMNSSEQYYRPVLEALCAFVREETKNKTGDEPPTADVQAALTVISRRNPKGEPGFVVNLSGAHIPKADLPDGTNLSRAILRGADLSGAYLIAANLDDTDLYGADLSGAYLMQADLLNADLSDANLKLAYLFRANLSRARLRATNLRGADLGEADLSGAYLLNAHLLNADLSDADLSGASFVEQEQLDQACGGNPPLKGLDGQNPPLTFHYKSCPPRDQR